jgi:hypothetical protein
MTRLKKKNPRIDALIPNVMIQCLKNDKKSMNIVHFEGETSFYNIFSTREENPTNPLLYSSRERPPTP